jgi:hypothetical protein
MLIPMPNSKTKIIIILSLSFTSFISGQVVKSPDRYLEAYKKYLNASCPIGPDSIRHFVYFARDRELIHDHPFLGIQRFAGAQIMYSWKQLEPEKGKYDFSAIREDYEYLRSHGKKLFIQFQDAFFSHRFVGLPDYLLTDEYDKGAATQYNDKGEITGWVAKRWNPKVQERFAMLMQALGKEFDGKVEGINLQETAIEDVSKTDSAFTQEGYTECLKINMLALKKAFPQSVTMQYANFVPGGWIKYSDKEYLHSVYQYGQQIGVGLGAPDLLFRRKEQLNHALAMMHEGTFTVPLGIAVQDGNYIEETGNTRIVKDRKNIVPVLHAFAKDFLKVKYMFWSCQEPYFSEDVVPCFRKR